MTTTTPTSRTAEDERTLLLTSLAAQRQLLRTATFGLTEDEVRVTPSASTLSLGGLVKHVALTEQDWSDRVRDADRVARGLPSRLDQDGDRTEAWAAYARGFRLDDDETLAGALAFYADVAAETEATVSAVDLDLIVPVPPDPWFAPGEVWTARRVLVHLLAETAQHTGHADIVRESLDGATAYPLRAAAEHWDAGGWVTPWERRRDDAPTG
ncbi:protein of unknown function DUF664 [Beutenbergia cavernae DSM 12333]|uniref:DinB-like domain-containing protein n=1 Tax=Beutenbergia cavernae (strain ATCC BAA-8 / DSM 12333 / CCUG 43141 / JCM 11478 / NBRC 16432 / NCIMB 13614 / HKI 0122) TaxID=471853 RepID=C5BVS2_BEUC1|nr:DinB family protein [Beutenbergia cavernae]ACQ78512.1 protein of unknown function DUF664 [Beutenbergia cavernae DSM 12333]